MRRLLRRFLTPFLSERQPKSPPRRITEPFSVIQERRRAVFDALLVI